MLKFIIPAIIIFLVVLFWEKIKEIILNRFKIKINYIITGLVIFAIGAIVLLLYY